MKLSAPSSFSASQEQPHKYHVFLSFRGADTRETFISHLYAALSKRGIATYLDDDGLVGGDEISETLMKAIEESKITVIVFSKDYASSTWCLNELLQILKCKETKDMFIIPTFYHVEPTHVRWQKGTYEAAFHKHNERCNTDVMNSWRTALNLVASLSGYTTHKFKSDAMLVEAIVDDILNKLDPTSFDDSYSLGLVGINERIEEIKSLLCTESQEVRIIGVWGMGGIGKTTLAHVLYNRIKSQFEGCCFLPNIRDTMGKQGENYLQKDFYRQLLKVEDPRFAQERLNRLKALIVLDDVDDPRQLKLFGVVKYDCFGPGSRIIITTRDKRVLEQIKPYHHYEVQKLSDEKALELIRLNADGSNIPPTDYKLLLERAVTYAGGIPLALIVLKSLLCGLTKEEWECELDKLKEVPNDDIQAVLKISYDRLDEKQKDIFLDIACFFKGEDKDSITRILDACGLYATSGITYLREKSLISIDKYYNTIQMHDLLQEMGRTIAGKEEFGKPKRIWNSVDVKNILEANTGAATIRGIILNIDLLVAQVALSPESFRTMSNLKFLNIYDPFYPHLSGFEYRGNNKVQLPQGLSTLPSELRYLRWIGYNYKHFPSMFSAENLVELIMPHCSLERLWEGVQTLGRLRKIDLSYSKHLVEIPDLSEAPKLESIDIEGCEELRRAPVPFQRICKLESVNLKYCHKLESFIESSRRFNTPSKNLELSSSIIKTLDLRATNIERVPSAIACLSNLESLYLDNCRRLKSISKNICRLKYLGTISLNGCPELEKFPPILEPMPQLQDLVFNGTTLVKGLPQSVKNLTGLKRLYLCHCSSLESIPKSIHNLIHLKILDLEGCSKLEKLPSLPFGLKELIVSDCKSLKSMELPLSLDKLFVENCISLEKILISSSSASSLTRTPNNCLLDKTLHHVGEKRMFNLRNCPKLEDSAVQSVLHVAMLRSTETLPEVDSITWLGNELPDWVMPQENGCSVRMVLPPNWHNSFFLCPVFCLVVGCCSQSHGNDDDNSDSEEDDFSGSEIEYVVQINPNSDEDMENSFFSKFTFNSASMSVNVDHKVLFMTSKTTLGPYLHSKLVLKDDHESISCHNSTDVVFKFKSDVFEIKKCRVIMLYSHEVEKYGVIIREEDDDAEEAVIEGGESSTESESETSREDVKDIDNNNVELLYQRPNPNKRSKVLSAQQEEDNGLHTRRHNDKLHPAGRRFLIGGVILAVLVAVVAWLVLFLKQPLVLHLSKID